MVTVVLLVLCLGLGTFSVTTMVGERMDLQVRKELEPPPAAPGDVEGNTPTVDWADLMDRYPDLAGWLSIEGTEVTLPVMSPVGHGEDWYLDHDETGAENPEGRCYLHSRCALGDPVLLAIAHNLGPQSVVGFSPLAGRYDQGAFDGLGRARWVVPGREWWMEPLCALEVDADDSVVQGLPSSTESLRPWLKGLLDRAPARCQDGEAQASSAEKALVTVTCTGRAFGREKRTLVVFTASSTPQAGAETSHG